MSPRLRRREALAAVAGVAAASTAGCSTIRSTVGLGSGLPSCEGDQLRAGELANGAPGDAAPTVAEFTDFSCPACASYYGETMPTVFEEYIEPATIRYVHHDYPIPVGKWALPVANAVRAAQDQFGNILTLAGFVPAMFERQRRDAYSMEFIESTAAEQLDSTSREAIERVRAAAENRPYCEVIREDRQLGEEMGVEGTPTIFVGGEKFENPSTGELADAIDDAIDDAGSTDTS
jgi:protein-disulfide isomerase